MADVLGQDLGQHAGRPPAQPGWLVLGCVLEALSLAGYSVLTRHVLPAGQRPGYVWLLRTDLTALGVAHVTPAGAATGNVVRFQLLRQGGTRSHDALSGMAVQAVGSMAALWVLFGVFLLASVPGARLTRVELTAAAGVGVALAVVLVGAWVGARRPARVPAVAGRLAVLAPRRWREAVEMWTVSLLERTGQILADRRLLRRCATWASLNWLLDAAALRVFLAAFGYHARPETLGVAYCLANVLAAVPLSPGGLGVVEAVAVSALVGAGAPRDLAVLGVVSWRLVSFWLPIPVAAACYASLQAQGRHWVSSLAAAIRSARGTAGGRPPGRPTAQQPDP